MGHIDLAINSASLPQGVDRKKAHNTKEVIARLDNIHEIGVESVLTLTFGRSN